MRNQLLKIFMLLLFITTTIIITNSCIKEKDFDFDRMAQNKYESEWAVPLVNSKIVLSDLIIDSVGFIQTDPLNQFLTVIYNTGDIWSGTGEDLIKIPNQSLPIIETATAPSSVPLGTYYEIKNQDVELVFNSAYTLDSILFKTDSKFQTVINTDINHKARYTITIQQLVDNNNNPFTAVVDLDINGGVASGSSTISLAGYKLAVNTGNKINMNYKVEVYGDANPFNISIYNLNILTSFKDIKFKYLIGYFGVITEPLSDTIPITLFSSNYESIFSLSRLKTLFYMKSSFGMPLRFKLNKFYLYNETESRDIIAPNYQFDGPFATKEQFGQTVSLVDSTPIAPNIMEIAPKYLGFSVDGTLNPDNNTSLKNFVLDNSKFSVDARIEIPLEGSFTSLSYRDTISFGFSNIDQLENMLFRIRIENAFPIDGRLQIFFADSVYNVFDSLLTQRSLIKSAITGPSPNYYTVANGISSNDIVINSSRILNLAKAKWIIIEAKLSSYNYSSQNVRFYGNQYMNLIMGTRVKVKANY